MMRGDPHSPQGSPVLLLQEFKDRNDAEEKHGPTTLKDTQNEVKVYIPHY